MHDWLTIECKKESDSPLQRFIQDNPVLDNTMRTLLATCLNLSESNLQEWIQGYKNGPSEYSQFYTNYVESSF